MSQDTLNSNVAAHASGAKRRKRAVLYLRVSTPSQVNTDYNPEGISIPAQRVAGERKAASLDADIVEEFIEPGKTATNIDKRPAFQEMVAWVKAQKDIDYVIVYHFNRVFRNAVDAGVVKRDLKKVGTRIVSTILDMGENPESAMVETILHAVDQYQSEASGADIKYKMGQKVKNGGSLAQAKLGYLNVREPKIGGGEIRTIAVDDERSPFVRLAFELYATDDYTLADLSDELYDRGLRSRATALHPVGQVGINKLSMLLRDRYYLGYVSYEGEEYQGRHEPLIEPDLFDRVQAIAATRSAAQERRRVHHHYLKGSVFCGRCDKAGVTQRLAIQHTVNRHGSDYVYFFCRQSRTDVCTAPHINALRVEQAIEAHYATIRFTPDFIAEVRTHVGATLADEEAATRLRHRQLTSELRALDAQEDNLINLVAITDDTVPTAKAKIQAKLRDIEYQRQHLTERLTETHEDLSDSARLIELCLQLLENPQELYRRCDDEQRRLLNQALFEGLYLDHDEVTGHELREPFALLHRLQYGRHSDSTDKPDPGTPTVDAVRNSKATPQSGSGLLRVLLKSTELDQGSNKTPRVELRGIEPLTFSMRTRRATNCATAPWSGESISATLAASAHPS